MKTIVRGLIATALFTLPGCLLEDTDDMSIEYSIEEEILEEGDPESDVDESESPLSVDDGFTVEDDPSRLGGNGCWIGSPNYPECQDDDDDWPDIDQPDCSAYSMCYCACRVANQCWNDASQCDDLAQCLNQCDANQPDNGVGCPFPSQPAQPTSIVQCL